MEKAIIQPDWTKVAEVELVYKSKVKAAERPLIETSKDCYETLMKLWDQNKLELREEFKVLFLNRANRVTGVYHLSTGGITGTVADTRLILAAALKSLSVALILAHNHPSGNLRPSRADEEITRKIKEAGRLLDIQLIDHLIITGEGYYSFADDGFI